MRKMMNKLLKLLVDNTILLILIVGTWIIVFLMLWNCSVKGCLKMTTSVNCARREYWKDAECIGGKILVRNHETYLLDEDTGEILAGSYAGIMVGDFEYPYHIARYITEDNLLGFIDEYGNEITPGIYTNATCFLDGKASVVDQDGNRYDIDTEGKICKGKKEKK